MDTLTSPSMTKETVRDFIALLTRHADLRREMKKVLFPELDLEKAFRQLTNHVNELAEAQKRTEASIQQLTSRIDQLVSRVLGLEIAQRRTEATLLQLIATRMEGLEQKVDAAKLMSLISQFGSRWGIYDESIWRQRIAYLIEKVYGDRVEECHIAGEQFDVVITNGKHILLEVTDRFKSHDFHTVERKRQLYTTHVQAPSHFIIAAASIHSRQARKLEEAGYELIEPEEHI